MVRANFPAFVLAALMMQSPRPFTRVVSSVTSGFSESVELVLRDRPSIREAWSTLANGVAGNPSPTVDLRRQILVLIALGPRSTGGHSVHVDSVVAAGNDVVVHYTATSPGRDCMTMQMITSPVDVISINRVTGGVRFKRHNVVGKC